MYLVTGRRIYTFIRIWLHLCCIYTRIHTHMYVYLCIYLHNGIYLSIYLSILSIYLFLVPLLLFICMMLGWKVHMMMSYLLLMTFFDQWDLSSATLMEEVCEMQRKLCWRINFICYHSMWVYLSEPLNFSANPCVCVCVCVCLYIYIYVIVKLYTHIFTKMHIVKYDLYICIYMNIYSYIWNSYPPPPIYMCMY